MAATPDPEHADTPTILDLVTAREDRAIVELILNRITLGRPVIGPPGIPADRVALLRTAFRRTVEDPEFQADLQRQRLALDPTLGAQAQEIIAQLYQSPARVVERTRKIVQFSGEP